MTSPYSPILTGAGLIKDGQLTQSARDRYVAEVVALLATGNADGKGGSPSTKLFNSLFPLPPVAGPTIFNVTTLQGEPLFWFGPDPIAARMATLLVDKTKTPTWNAIFPDLLYAKTAVALDLNGSTPLFPVFDVTVAFPDVKGFPLKLPELAAKLNMTLPELTAKLLDLAIQLSIPSIPSPPSLPLPNLMPPALPNITLPGLPPLVLPDLMLGLIKLPFDLLKQLVLPPDIGIVLDLPGLPKAVLGFAIKIVLDLLTGLGMLLTLPKVLIASLLIYIKDVVAMVCTDIVGLLVGAGGSMTKTIAGLTGLN